MQMIIDLDAQATSPLRPEALKAMLPWLERQHWNPHSAHKGGRLAKAALEAARVQVASLLGGDAEGLLFTSGATEANNLALKGVMEGRGSQKLLTFATEHSCVLQTARHLENLGFEIRILPVLANGLPDLEAYQQALAADVALVSAMWVNNEIGTIWPIAQMAKMARDKGALFHTDCAQAFGKLDIQGSGADLVSISAHKIGGPKGIGGLWVRKGVDLAPLLDGGGQEAGLRSGTQAPALAAGFGAAAMAAQKNDQMAAGQAHVRHLMGLALRILEGVPHHINGADPLGANRWAGNLSVQFVGVDSARLITALPELALSSGSACSSGSGKPSHVLAAIGVSGQNARQTLRIGWHHATQESQFVDALQRLVSTARQLRGAA